MDLVSVIVPTHNRAAFLGECMESVLDQTYNSVECLVVDGKSTDDTPAVLQGFDDDRLRVQYRDRRHGPSNARNRGVELAQGDTVVFLDADDVFYPQAVERLVATMDQQQPECGAVVAAADVVSPDGRTQVQSVVPGVVTSIDELQHFSPSCTLVSRQAFEALGGFDESFPTCEDYDFWLRLFGEYHAVGIDQPLFRRRLHPDQLSRDGPRMAAGRKRLLEKHDSRLSNRTRAGLHFLIAQQLAKSGNLRPASRHLRHSVRLYPWSSLTADDTRRALQHLYNSGRSLLSTRDDSRSRSRR